HSGLEGAKYVDASRTWRYRPATIGIVVIHLGGHQVGNLTVEELRAVRPDESRLAGDVRTSHGRAALEGVTAPGEGGINVTARCGDLNPTPVVGENGQRVGGIGCCNGDDMRKCSRVLILSSSAVARRRDNDTALAPSILYGIV